MEIDNLQMFSETFFETIRSQIKSGILTKNLKLSQVLNFIQNHNFELSKKIHDLSFQLERVKGVQNLNLYGKFFVIVTYFLKKMKEQGEVGEIPQITEDFINLFVDCILKLISLEKFCTECNSRNISITSNPFNEIRVQYFCRDCQKSVRISQNIEYIPLLILYIKRWSQNSKSQGKIRNIDNSNNNYRDFIIFLFCDCLNYYKDKGNLLSLSFYYDTLEINEIEHVFLKDRLLFKSILIDNIEKALKKQDFLGFLEGKRIFQNKHGDLSEHIDHLSDLILSAILMSLKSGDYLKIKQALMFFNFTVNENFKVQIEENFYKGLSNCLKSGKFNNFREIINLSDKFDIFFDKSKIQDVFENIAKLLDNCMREISVGYHTSSLGDIIEIINFFNEYSLLERVFEKDELKIIETLKKDKLLLSNLKDLFGRVSYGLLYFVYRGLPQNLYDFFLGDRNLFSFYSNTEQMASYISMFFDRYSVYGLSVQKIGSLSRFVKKCLKTREDNDSNKHLNGSSNFVELHFRNRKHLVSPENIKKNKENILSKKYNFYSLSMVLLGGLGPQGHGFTYSTPKGEVIEICSDIKENEAIIVKYKQFLKRQFLAKLQPEMIKMNINAQIIKKIMNYLKEIMDKRELIDYYKKGAIIRQIKNFLQEDRGYQKKSKSQFNGLMEKITNAIILILRNVKMEDQFKTRMDLIGQDKIKSEDIAKLTSLKDKSHYDVLRERFFYQYVINWFYEIYMEKRQNG